MRSSPAWSSQAPDAWRSRAAPERGAALIRMILTRTYPPHQLRAGGMADQTRRAARQEGGLARPRCRGGGPCALDTLGLGLRELEEVEHRRRPLRRPTCRG